MADYGVVCSLDYRGERTKGGGDGGIVVREEIWASGAFVEICGDWGVDYFLDVGAVEIIVWSAAQGGEAEFVIEIRTEICEVVDVEAWVYVVCCVVDIIV